jgi:hypothetical protein
VAGFVVAVLFAGIAWEAWQARRIGRGLVDGVLVAAGCALPLLGLMLWYRHLGILDDAIFWSWTYILKYYLPSTSQPFWMNVLEYLGPFLLLVSPLLVLATAARPFARYAVAWVWFWGGLGAALVGGRMYGHYFLMMVPGLCVLAGVGGAHLLGPKAPSPWPRRWVWLATPLVAVGGLVSAALYEPATESFWSRKPDYRQVTEYVRQTTAQDDRIFVWGWFPPLYVESDRCPATRFVTAHVLAGAAMGEGAKGHSVTRGWDLLMGDLEQSPPPLILDTSTAPLGFEYASIDRYPRLAHFVDAHYREEARVADVRILRRIR